jgi:hypothetical protein
MSKPQRVDPFASDEAEVEVDAITVLKQRTKTAQEGRLVPPRRHASESSNGFQGPLYHDDTWASSAITTLMQICFAPLLNHFPPTSALARLLHPASLGQKDVNGLARQRRL